MYEDLKHHIPHPHQLNDERTARESEFYDGRRGRDRN